MNDQILGVVWAIAELSLVENNNNNNNNNNNILMRIMAKRGLIIATFFNAVATVDALTANSKDRRYTRIGKFYDSFCLPEIPRDIAFIPSIVKRK